MNFFNKIGEKASEVYNTTADKTNKLTREMKLKSSINDNKGKITKIYQEIGEKVYQAHKSNEKVNIEKDFSEQLYQIDLYQKEIEDSQAEIRSLKDLKLCESCLKEMNLTAKFCPFCGAEQKQVEIIKNGEQSEEKKENVIEPIEKLDENETIEVITSNDNSKREPQLVLDKTILDVEEPEIIVEEIVNTDKNDDDSEK